MLLIQSLDADADGTLSKEEIEGAAEALKKLDKNEDGSLSRDEYLGPLPPLDPAATLPGGPGFGPSPLIGGGEQVVRSILTTADKDGDEKLSKEEAIGPLKDNFDRIDRNQDGQLDREELMVIGARVGVGVSPEEMTQQMVARILENDKDGDEKISKEEAPGGMKDNFDNLDGNKDGALDREELTALARRIGGGRGPRGVAEGMVNRLMESSDADKDGKISKEEAPERLKERFDAVDANKDGFADREELVSAIGRLGIGRPGVPPGDAVRPRPEAPPPPEEAPKEEPKE
jgi:Ca2+-binding EF-hand superfamily protein